MQDFNASNAQSFKLKNNVKEKAWNQLPNFNLAEFLLILYRILLASLSRSRYLVLIACSVLGCEKPSQ